jgi:N-acetylmuramoyl-L-alanine amidase
VVNIIQYPGIYFGYPNQANHGRQGREIVAICHHTFDGWWPFYQKIVQGLAPGYKNSANYSITTDGVIRQHVQDGDSAWCNGLDWSAGGLAFHHSDLHLPWLADAYARRISPNCYTISIELEGRSGNILTPAQYASLLELDKLLIERHPKITRDRIGIVGHYQIDGVNKQGCPGTGFNWSRLLTDLTPVVLPHVLASPDAWEGVGSGLAAVGRAHPDWGVPNHQAKDWHYWDADNDEVVKLTTGDWLAWRQYTNQWHWVHWG